MRPRIADRPQRRYRRCTVRIEVEWATKTQSHVDRATTLGAGGLFIETTKPLLPGATLEVRFRVQDGGALHEIPGRVVWCRPAGDQPGGMGIEFTEREAAVPLAIELERL